MVRVAKGTLALVVILLVVWAALHVMITPVNPEQSPSGSHVQSACWACHLVVSSAGIIEVD